MTVKALYPTVLPSLNLDFANSKKLDPRVTFTRASTGTFVNENGLVATAASGAARFDHDPVTGKCLGLLVEEARTNLLPRSEEFDNAAWTKNNVTVTANAVLAPNGTTTADKISHTGSSVSDSGVQGNTASTPSASIFSVFVKAAEYTNFHIREYTSTGVQATFNLTTGTVGASNATAGIQNIGNGWYRVHVAIATATTVSFNMFGVTSPTYQWPTSWSPVNGNGIYLWGAQLEAGSFPTSYIPTVAATVTRAADVASITGTNFSSWYRQDEGTFYTDKSNLLNGTGNTPCIFSLHNASDISSYDPNIRIAAGDAFAVYTGGAYSLVTSALPAKRHAFALKANNFAVSATGGTPVTDNSGALPTVGSLFFNNYYQGSESGAFLLKRLTYYPVRLPDAQLQALTAT
jgi:hypothetical protein